jgi:hypothetical protein
MANAEWGMADYGLGFCAVMRELAMIAVSSQASLCKVRFFSSALMVCVVLYAADIAFGRSTDTRPSVLTADFADGADGFHICVISVISG